MSFQMILEQTCNRVFDTECFRQYIFKKLRPLFIIGKEYMGMFNKKSDISTFKTSFSNAK